MKRFWDKVDKSGECWLWTGYRARSGYGRFTLDYKACWAHRVSYELAIGPIPLGLLVRHSCDNPPCVNPAHLSLGTDLDNSMDCVRRGRHISRPVRGEKHPNARLTWHDVIDIRSLHAFGATQGALARSYGVDSTNVSMICRGVTWKGVPTGPDPAVPVQPHDESPGSAVPGGSSPSGAVRS